MSRASLLRDDLARNGGDISTLSPVHGYLELDSFADGHDEASPTRTSSSGRRRSDPPLSDPRNPQRSIQARKLITLGMSVAAAAIVFSIPLDPNNVKVQRAAAIAVLMGCLWATEVVPLPATALLPIALGPLLGTSSTKLITSQYFNGITALIVGGCLIAAAMRKWNLHRRVALAVISRITPTPAKLVASMMGISAVLSMLISNTAAVMTVVPIGVAICDTLESTLEPSSIDNFATALFLGMAYGGSIGGLATLIGTPTNLILVRNLETMFPASRGLLSFTSWLIFTAPFVISLFAATFGILWFKYIRGRPGFAIDQSIIQKSKSELGPVMHEERVVLACFVFAALSWATREELVISGTRLPGWTTPIPHGKDIDDGCVAIAVALPLFFFPSKNKPPSSTQSEAKQTEQQHFILDWATASKELPWDLLIVIGGGFGIAQIFQASGLSEFLGARLNFLHSLSPIVAIFGVTGMLTFLTEFMSNVTAATLLLPLMGSAAIGAGRHPLVFMLPCTIGASFAFALPSASGANAAALTSKRVAVKDMMKTGVVLNVFSLFICTLFVWLWSPVVFGYTIDGTMPAGWHS